jgi:hypothetical protein
MNDGTLSTSSSDYHKRPAHQQYANPIDQPRVSFRPKLSDNDCNDRPRYRLLFHVHKYKGINMTLPLTRNFLCIPDRVFLVSLS